MEEIRSQILVESARDEPSAGPVLRNALGRSESEARWGERSAIFPRSVRGTFGGGDGVVPVVRLLFVSIGTLLLWCAVAAADIGIVSVSAKTAWPGQRVSVRVAGYLGPKPWHAYPIVLVPQLAEPRPYKCGTRTICGPTRLLGTIRKAPFHVVGSVTHWHTLRGISVSGWGLIVFRVPKLASGVYVPMLVCAGCARGPRVSLIATRGLALRIH